MSPISLCFLPDFGIFSAFISLSIFSAPHSCSVLYVTWMTWILDLLLLSQALWFCSCFSVCVFLLFRLGYAICMCSSSLILSCHLHSATEPSQWVFNLKLFYFSMLSFLFDSLFCFFSEMFYYSFLFQECS